MANVTAVGSGGASLGTPPARWALCAVWALGVTHGAIEGDFAQPDPRRLAAYAVPCSGRSCSPRRAIAPSTGHVHSRYRVPP